MRHLALLLDIPDHPGAYRGRVYTFTPPYLKKISHSTSTLTPTSKNSTSPSHLLSFLPSHSPYHFHFIPTIHPPHLYIFPITSLKITPKSLPHLSHPISILNIPPHSINSKIILSKFNITLHTLKSINSLPSISRQPFISLHALLQPCNNLTTSYL